MGEDTSLRAPTGQALVSDQAAARPAPSGFDPSRYQVGQRLWFVPSSKYQHAEYVLISKVGRKWATVKREKYSSEVGRVQIGSYTLDGGDYSSPGTLYGSAADHEEATALNLMWEAVKATIRGLYSRPRHMTRDRLEAILRLLRDSDGNPEGGNAVPSRSDDSAGRQASQNPDILPNHPREGV